MHHVLFNWNEPYEASHYSLGTRDIVTLNLTANTRRYCVVKMSRIWYSSGHRKVPTPFPLNVRLSFKRNGNFSM